MNAKTSFYIVGNLSAGPMRYALSKAGARIDKKTFFPLRSIPKVNFVYVKPSSIQYGIFPQLQKPTSSTHRSKIMKSSASTLLKELNFKHRKRSLFPIALAIVIVALISMIALNVPLPVILAVGFGGLAIARFTYHNDYITKSTLIYYRLDPQVEKGYAVLWNAFKELSTWARIWHIQSGTQLGEWQARKREAGANALISRGKISPKVQQPKYLRTNILVPCIPLGQRTLYFLPDRLLVFDREKVAAFNYASLKVKAETTRFIEDSETSVPKDATVVDQTWRYVNKDGSPDKRFNNNRLLPIVEYGEVHFEAAGLEQTIQVSQVKAARTIEQAVEHFTSAIAT